MPRTALRALLAVIVSLGALFAAPVRAHAQEGRVDGVVYDSLRHAPLAGAIIQLVQPPPGRAYSATTDSLGRFAIANVKAGEYVAGILHPLLDTLGVQAPYGSVTVTSGSDAHVALTIPSAAQIVTAICAPPSAKKVSKIADTTGTLVGHVYDALSGATVGSSLIAIMWPVLSVDARGVHGDTRQLHEKANEDGWFALCGLDPGDYQMRAESGGRSTGYIDITVKARDITRTSLILGADSSAGARLAGKVVTKDGRPLEGAQVVVDGSKLSAATDARGVFTIAGLPNGSRMAEARALGYAPTRAPVNPSDDDQPPVTIVMEKRVETLEQVTVFGKKTTRMRDLTGFVERSKRGFGHFITREQIDKRDPRSVCDLLREVPGVTVSTGEGLACDASIRGAASLSTCGLTVYVDNMKFGSVPDFASSMSPHEIGGMEVYSSATEPVQFPGGCGSLVVWTR